MEKHMKFMDTADGASEGAKPASQQVIRNIVDREALEQANRAIAEVGMDKEVAYEGAVDSGVVPVRYTTLISGNWQIDHGQRELDYMVQMIPRKPIDVAIGDICKVIIDALMDIIPNEVQVYITPPNSRLHIEFYTVRLEAVMRRPGAELIVKRRVPEALGAINAWPGSR